MMGGKNFTLVKMLAFIYRKLRRNESKANGDDDMKTSGEEEQEEEASKGNLQAMIMMKSPREEEEENAMSMWDCGSPLYDSYELVSLDHIIERNLMAFPFSHGSSKPTITKFTHHDLVAHKIGSQEKSSKGCFVVTSLSKFWVKRNKMNKNNEEMGKKNKEIRTGFVGFVQDLLYWWRK